MKVTHAVALVLAFGLGVAAEAAVGRAWAEPQAPFDRALVERLVRASERQADAAKELVRANERQADATRELVSVTRDAAHR